VLLNGGHSNPAWRDSERYLFIDRNYGVISVARPGMQTEQRIDRAFGYFDIRFAELLMILALNVATY